MRINELLSEDQLNEGLGAAIVKGIGATTRGIGSVAGGAHGAWDAMKQGYKIGRSAVSGMGNDMSWDSGTDNTGRNIAPASTKTSLEPQAAAQPDELEQLKTTIAKLTPQQKQEVSAALQAPAAQQQPAAQQPAAQQPAAPAGTSVDIGQVKKQSAQQAQADKTLAQQQISATQTANAEKAKQDAAIKAAKDAAMAKPAFQQTASNKLAIQKAQQMGIREAKQPKKPAKKPTPGKKKKIVAEFNSKFLGQMI